MNSCRNFTKNYFSNAMKRDTKKLMAMEEFLNKPLEDFHLRNICKNTRIDFRRNLRMIYKNPSRNF